MHNPILKNRSFSIAYFGAWMALALLNLFLLLYFYDFPIIVSISESLVYNLIFAGVGIGIWYPVYYTDFEKNSPLNFLTNHLASGSLAVGLWLWLSFLIQSSLFFDETAYLEEISKSIPWRVGVGFLMYIVITSNFYLYIYYQNFKTKVVRESELKSLVKESELKSLKSQINPHFLFNSLNSISSLTMISPERAQEMVINLSDFLRYSLSQKQESLTTFEQELKNIDRYLKIEKIRFGKRLHVEREINEKCLRCRLPGLILQPIMENAIKYGVYESTDQSKILIGAKCSSEVLEISIKNEYDPDFMTNKGEGIGLRNVSSRMKIQYGPDDLVRINRADNSYEIILRFPQTF